MRPGDQEGQASTQAYLWRGVDKTQRRISPSLQTYLPTSRKHRGKGNMLNVTKGKQRNPCCGKLFTSYNLVFQQVSDK